jgi:NAD(P)-dependent dehydrogenase (short-subunit alcohol dehydrogenase family)
MIKKIMNKYSKIDVLINNAAYQGDDKLRTKKFENFPKESWEKAISVNLTGIFLCCQEVGKIMKKQKRGNIINIASTYGIVAPDQRIYGESKQNAAAFYSATKSAVINFTRYLASYWSKSGIRVNTLSPGGVFKNQNPDFVRKYSSKTMLGRMARKDEYVAAIIFLCSDASSYMTGSNLIIDGGWTAW